MAVIGVAAWLLPGAKATMLGLWALWCLILIAFLVALEYIKQSIEQAAELGEMPDAELRQALIDETAGDGVLLAGAGASAAAAGGSDAVRTAVLERTDVESEPDDDTAVLDELFGPDADTDADVEADADVATDPDPADAETVDAPEDAADAQHPEPDDAPPHVSEEEPTQEGGERA